MQSPRERIPARVLDTYFSRVRSRVTPVHAHPEVRVMMLEVFLWEGRRGHFFPRFPRAAGGRRGAHALLFAGGQAPAFPGQGGVGAGQAFDPRPGAGDFAQRTGSHRLTLDGRMRLC